MGNEVVEKNMGELSDKELDVLLVYSRTRKCGHESLTLRLKFEFCNFYINYFCKSD